MRALCRWNLLLTALASIACLVAAGASARAESPGLIADHFSLSVSASQAFARADEAIRAAGLTVDPPTAISRGGHNSYLAVLIHCIESGKTVLVDLEVADIAHGAEALSMRAFMSEFMKTGRATMSSGKGFDGDWDARSPPGIGFRMRMKQTGDRVTGSYQTGSYSGTLEGTVTGSVLRFRWTQSNGSKGVGKFTLSADGQSFTGSYSYSDDSDKNDGYWNGKRPGAK